MMYFISYILLYPVIIGLSRLPFWVIYRISDALYFFTYYIIQYRKKIVFNNLKLVFPEKSSKEIELLAKEFYRHFCDILMESVKAFSMSKATFEQRYTFLNLDLLHPYYAKQKSIMLVGSHYANWEWFIHAAADTKHTLYGTYNTLKNPYFNTLIRNSRGRFGGALVATNETIPEIIKNDAIGKLSIYGLVSDQSPMLEKTQYWSTFMGIKVPIHTGAELLAKKYNLPVVYFNVERIKRGFYQITLTTLAEEPREYANFTITDAYIALIEQQIMKAPAYYFWTHKRWKHKDKAPV